MKDIILVISILLAVGLSVVLVRVAQKADKADRNLQEERYSRMVAEETLQKNDAKLTTYQEEIKEDQDKMAKIVDILEQEKGVNENLKKQYDELTQAKANLQAKLETVLQEKSAAAAVLQAQPVTQPPVAAAPVPTASTSAVAVPAASQSTAAGH